MLLDELMVVIDLDNVMRAPHPHGFADETMRHRVGFVVKLDVMVRMDFGLFPLGHVERLVWQRFQPRLFQVAKGGIGLQAGSRCPYSLIAHCWISWLA